MGTPRIDYGGRRFVNGSWVLRCEGRIRVGSRLMPRWLVQCACGETFSRSSNAVGHAVRGGLASRCDACASRFLAHAVRCTHSANRVRARRRVVRKETKRVEWRAWHAANGEAWNQRRREARSAA